MYQIMLTLKLYVNVKGFILIANNVENPCFCLLILRKHTKSDMLILVVRSYSSSVCPQAKLSLNC